ncbi:MAG: hypothetical protein HYZ28_24590 [Myxococcales bacterium]|nr:hypothetical protein [Myxococcales bacterium]
MGTEWLERNAAAAERSVESFCEESARLARAGLEQPATARRRDASSYMTVRVDWEGGVRPPGLLHLSEPLRQRMREYGNDWPKRVREQDYAGLDFSWMGELHQFDHWDVLAEGPLRDGREVQFVEAPIPNFFDLMTWAKLRFARALRAGDLAAASQDVRQLALLLRTTGLLLADMVALGLLRIEAAAYEAAASAGLPLSGWRPHDAAALDAYRRTARAAPNFLLPGVPEHVMRRAFECNAISRCSAVVEAVGMHASLGQLSRKDTRGAVTSIADGSGCDAQMLEWLRRSPPLTPERALEVLGNWELPSWPASDGGR